MSDIILNGLNVSILYLLLFIIFVCFIVGIFSNSYLKNLYLGFLILILSIPIIEETFYYNIKNNISSIGNGDCLSVIVDGICDIWNANVSISITYSRAIINLPNNFGFYIAFLGILLITKSIILYTTNNNFKEGG